VQWVCEQTPAWKAEGKFILWAADAGKRAFGSGGELKRWAVVFRQQVGESFFKADEMTKAYQGLRGPVA
jgi:hypothetical protein